MKDIIKYYTRSQIDNARWDEAITRAANGRIYALSTYLDAMAPGWACLATEDFRFVMPLPIRKKYRVSYIFYPPFTAQLGIFGDALTTEITEAFFKSIPDQFRLVQMPLNPQNNFTVEGFPLQQRANYVLSLQPSYEVLYEGYRENIKRNIKKCFKLGCREDEHVGIDEILKLALETFKSLLNKFSPSSFKAYGIRSKEGELLSSAIFLFSHNRAYYILVGNSPNGKTLGASHALIDLFIRKHASQDLTLDFEGSDLRNLAFFYSSFGAKQELYPVLNLNRLPWYMRIIKK